MKIHRILALAFLLTAPASLAAATTLNITDYGAKPGSKQNALPAVRAALAAAKKHPGATIVFPKGRYDFFPTHEPHRHPVPFDISETQNLTIDGNGSEFVFHEMMGTSVAYLSKNITFKNFTIDWDKPYIVQGAITAATDTTLDIRFDTRDYPCEIINNKIHFTGENWCHQVDGYTILFNPETKELIPGPTDYPLGDFDKVFNQRAEQLSDGLVRFHSATKLKLQPTPGTLIALWLVRYRNVAFYLKVSSDITLENITVYHTPGMGVVAEHVENLTIRSFDILANKNKNRVFSAISDGFHFNACKGRILVENCTMTGAGDDFLNVHGKNVRILRRVDDRTLELAVTGHDGYSNIFAPGDEAWLVDQTTMQRAELGKVEKITDIHNPDKTLAARQYTFVEKLPATIRPGDCLENKTWNPDITIRNCNILKSHRARGLLISTPGRVIVENNYFRTAGAAILIAGDADYWFESGAVRDVLIRNNTFEDCLTSTAGNAWGRAIIQIFPSHKPQTDTCEPYHQNIRIENNIIKTFDSPVLYARSVRNLQFTNNTLSKTTTFTPMNLDKPTYHLNGCRDATITNNTHTTITPTIRLENMRPTDLPRRDPQITPTNK